MMQMSFMNSSLKTHTHLCRRCWWPGHVIRATAVVGVRSPSWQRDNSTSIIPPRADPAERPRRKPQSKPSPQQQPQDSQRQKTRLWEEEPDYEAGMGMRHRRVDMFDIKEKQQEGAVLPWHRRGLQKDLAVLDAIVHTSAASPRPATSSSSGSRSRGTRGNTNMDKSSIVAFPPSTEKQDGWWKDWKMEWDDGWDWEDRWHPAPGKMLESRNDPRGPRGPLLPTSMLMQIGAGEETEVQTKDSCRDGGYRPVATLGPSEATAAIISAIREPTEEIIWQALCRRVEIIAPMLSPAELLAVIRCVSSRQAGQLRLLWKLAGNVVENLASYTEKDLVSLAQAYSSLDAVHVGLLNVTALVLADPEDERCLSPQLAVDLLAAFANANHLLPLVVQEGRRVLLPTDKGSASPTLSSGAALSALQSLTVLRGLDQRALGALLPSALQAETASKQLQASCAACKWASVYRRDLLELEETGEGAQEVREEKEDSTVSGPDLMSGAEALRKVLDATRLSWKTHDLQHMRLLRRKQGMQCLIPQKAQGTLQPTRAVALDGPALLAAAEFLLGCGQTSDRAEVAAVCLAVATPSQAAESWELDLRVRWLAVASECAQEAQVGQPEWQAAKALLDSLISVPGIQLLQHGVALVSNLNQLDMALHIAEGDEMNSSITHSIVVAAKILIPAIRDNLFRLTQRDALKSLKACLWMSSRHTDLHSEMASLVKRVVATLPAKLRAESMFQRGGGGAVGGVADTGLAIADLAAWCNLLANRALLESSGGAGGSAIPESLWVQLGGWASQAVLSSDFSHATVVLLQAFAAEGVWRGWSASDASTPLGQVANIIAQEWRRNTLLDGEEAEDPVHEPLPVPGVVAKNLRELFVELGLDLPCQSPESEGAPSHSPVHKTVRALE